MITSGENERDVVLGKEVKDRVTGFVGIATSWVKYLNGCVQFGVTPKIKAKQNKKPEVEYIDQGQLEIISKGINIKKKKTGGFRSDHPEF